MGNITHPEKMWQGPDLSVVFLVKSSTRAPHCSVIWVDSSTNIVTMSKGYDSF